MFGYEPRHWGVTAEGTCSVPTLQFWLAECTTVQALLQQHLNRAQ